MADHKVLNKMSLGQDKEGILRLVHSKFFILMNEEKPMKVIYVKQFHIL